MCSIFSGILLSKEHLHQHQYQHHKQQQQHAVVIVVVDVDARDVRRSRHRAASRSCSGVSSRIDGLQSFQKHEERAAAEKRETAAQAPHCRHRWVRLFFLLPLSFSLSLSLSLSLAISLSLS